MTQGDVIHFHSQHFVLIGQVSIQIDRFEKRDQRVWPKDAVLNNVYLASHKLWAMKFKVNWYGTEELSMTM